MNWTATLVGWEGDKQRIKAAEMLFRTQLEAEFGPKISSFYWDWLNASSRTHDTPGHAWSAEDQRAIERWELAVTKSTAHALSHLPGKGHEAYFDVQVDCAP